ncbi:MAG: lactoylglutathione lyase [Fluviicola sp. XM-24bin1]|nr:MAG: lactoylglutathione lyase [Fluviicola sp. XM-24bin1]
MNTFYLEHANITVNNMDNAVYFLKTAFPHFEKRGGGVSNGRTWLHFGDETTYVALNTPSEDLHIQKDYKSSGINHLGFVVSDAGTIAKHLLDAGYKRSFPRQEEQFRIREYFYDADGNEYEFVEYLSDLASERNSYA